MIQFTFSSKFWCGRFVMALPILALGMFTIPSSSESQVTANQS
jgi:hypothetical protein